jgi:DNA end-binding protein Ku
MAARSSWEGFLQFNLISVPVKAYSATVANKGRIGFHMIHAGCGSRIRYQKLCPIHGEVSNDQIVPGYEQAKGEYVTVKKEEISKLKAENDKTITIDVFVDRNALDPVYGSGRSFFLTPDGKNAQKPYAVLQQVMKAQERCALAQIVFSGREQVALIRAAEGVLIMTLLYFDEQIKKPSSIADEIADVTITAQERKLAETLIETATSKKLDFSKYKDIFTGKIARLLATKSARAGKRATGKTKDKGPPHIINLMDALKKSLAATKQGKASPRRPAAHASKRPHRKTG